MTAAVLAAVLLAGAVAQAGLPLADPLNWWHYILETDYDGSLSTGSLGSVERFIESRSGSPIESLQESPAISLTGTIAGEVLNNSDNFETRTGATARLFVDILPGLYLDEQLSIWTGSDEKPPDYFSPYHQGSEQGRHLYVDWGYLRFRSEIVSLGLEEFRRDGVRAGTRNC